MALTGRLEGFPLPDLIQLVVGGGKSGVITLSDDVDEIVLSLRETWVVRVENTSRPGESELATRLATVGLINGVQLGRILKQLAESKRGVARILIDDGYAPLEKVRQFATLQAIDTLFEVFTWRTGSYTFEEKEPAPPLPWVEPIATDYLLMRGIELVDEWPAASALIPSISMRVSRLKELDRGPSMGLESLVADLQLTEGVGEGEIGEHERAMFALCRPGLAVKTVLERMPTSRFEASRALANLIRAGYVRLD